MKKPDKIPGVIAGSKILLNICQELAPKSLAASTNDLSNYLSRGKTINTTIGIEKAI